MIATRASAALLPHNVGHGVRPERQAVVLLFIYPTPQAALRIGSRTWRPITPSTPPLPLTTCSRSTPLSRQPSRRPSPYTVWNMLDRLNKTLHNLLPDLRLHASRPARGARHRCALSGVRTYCEVGFNGGHSAAAVLLAPNVTVRSFDAYGKHTRQNADFLAQMQPDRFTLIDGDSAKTLVQLGHRVRDGAEPPCDVFIDGSHKLSQVEHDLRNFRASVRRPPPPRISLDSSSLVPICPMHAHEHVRVRALSVRRRRAARPSSWTTSTASRASLKAAVGAGHFHVRTRAVR